MSERKEITSFLWVFKKTKPRLVSEGAREEFRGYMNLVVNLP